MKTTEKDYKQMLDSYLVYIEDRIKEIGLRIRVCDDEENVKLDYFRMQLYSHRKVIHDLYTKD